MPDKQDIDRAQKFVEAELAGAEPREAARAAGFSDKTKLIDIRAPGSPVAVLMEKALRERGITPEFIAGEYARGVAGALEDGASDKRDHQAHAKYLLQLSYLYGLGKKDVPQVAVQINNGQPQSGQLDIARVEETLAETRKLLGVVRAKLSAREADSVHGEGDPVAGGDQLRGEAPPHSGVGETGGEPRQAPGGSQP